MEEEIKKYLQDVLNAVTEVEGYFSDKPLLFEEFQNNLMERPECLLSFNILGDRPFSSECAERYRR